MSYAFESSLRVAQLIDDPPMFMYDWKSLFYPSLVFVQPSIRPIIIFTWYQKKTQTPWEIGFLTNHIYNRHGRRGETPNSRQKETDQKKKLLVSTIFIHNTYYVPIWVKYSSNILLQPLLPTLLHLTQLQSLMLLVLAALVRFIRSTKVGNIFSYFSIVIITLTFWQKMKKDLVMEIYGWVVPKVFMGP